MKPDTLNVFTNLAIEEAKEDMNALADAAENEELDPSRYRDAAQACRNIIEVMEALENLYLTAADELDAVIMGVDLAAEAILEGVQGAEPVGILNSLHRPGINASDHFNVAYMTPEEHAEAHSGMPRWGYI